MSKSNPRKAMAALLPLPLKVSGGYSVKPMTLGMWAALERIGSPLVTGEEPDFHVRKLDDWIVFPHEIDGLSDAEVARKDPALAELVARARTGA